MQYCSSDWADHHLIWWRVHQDELCWGCPPYPGVHLRLQQEGEGRKGLAVISSAHCNLHEYMQLTPVGNTTEDGLFRGRVCSLKAKNICTYILYMYIYTLEFGFGATPNTAQHPTVNTCYIYFTWNPSTALDSYHYTCNNNCFMWSSKFIHHQLS